MNSIKGLPDLVRNDNDHLEKKENINLPDSHGVVVDTSSAVIGSLVGLIVGGPFGAVAGAATSPILANTTKIIMQVLKRRKERAMLILETAFCASKISIDESISILADDSQKADELFNIVRKALESDPCLDRVFGSILREIIHSQTEVDIERFQIIGDAIRGLRTVHLRALRSVFKFGGSIKSSLLSDDLGIPEIELRSVVRDLELKGMIKDKGGTPLVWELRELGTTLIKFLTEKE